MCRVKSIANTWTKRFDYIQEIIFYVGDVLVAAKGKHNWEGEPTLSNERHEGSWIEIHQQSLLTLRKCSSFSASKTPST